MRELRGLPPSWVKASVGEIAAVNPSGSTVSTSDETLVSFIPMASVAELDGSVDLSDRRAFGVVKKGFTRFKDDDLIVAKITPSMENGKAAVVRGLEGGIGCGSTEFHVIRSESGVQPDYLRYFVTQSVFRQEAKQNMQGAVGQQRVPAGFIRDACIPLAPSLEQTRIVSKIDELFSSIDEGERALERVRVLVERYRQSVLKAAVTGELTREWREQHAGELESGEALLTRILEARRQAWETAELAKMTAKKQRPSNDLWKKKYDEPPSPDITKRSALPEGWVWATMEQLSSRVVDGTHFKPDYVDSGVPFISVKDVRNGKVSFDQCKMISRHDHAVLSGRCNPEAGDLLVTKSGTIGRTAVVAPGPPFSLFVSVALVKTLPGVIPEWLKLAFDLWFLSVNVANDITGTAIKNLHLIDLKAISIPLPPRDEQLEILDHWKIHASKLENLITQNESTARLKAALTQSILKSAFSGDLAPQDSTDEPASTLLQRIAAQRAAAVSEASAAKERKSKRGFPSGMTDRKANASTTATRKGKA